MSETTKSRTRSAYIALITGSARRIGACIAETLHQRGCDVILHYHQNGDAAIHLAEKLNARADFPPLTLQVSGGGELILPQLKDDGYSIVLFYRGHW